MKRVTVTPGHHLISITMLVYFSLCGFVVQFVVVVLYSGCTVSRRLSVAWGLVYVFVSVPPR